MPEMPVSTPLMPRFSRMRSSAVMMRSGALAKGDLIARLQIAVCSVDADVVAAGALAAGHPRQRRERIRHFVECRLLSSEGNEGEFDVVERCLLDWNSVGVAPADGGNVNHLRERFETVALTQTFERRSSCDLLFRHAPGFVSRSAAGSDAALELAVGVFPLRGVPFLRRPGMNSRGGTVRL